MKLSYEQLKEFVANVITEGNLSNEQFLATQNNTAKLLDKIGKIITLDTTYNVDKLAIFDGEYLSFGKTIEEWSEDLIMPQDKDEDGAGALAPHRPTYRPVFYSYTVGKKVIKTTIDYNDLERAVHFVEQFTSLIAMKYKRLEDSMAVYRYQMKREMIAKLYEISTRSSKDEWSHTPTGLWRDEMAMTFNVGDILEINQGEQSLQGYFYHYIAVKEIASDNTSTLIELINDGHLIPYDIVKEIAKPVDTTTGEDFIKQVKADVEVASDLSEGHSLNGNSLGATEGLVLILKQKIMPSVEVDTWAGAFNKELLALPAEVIVVKDFGSCNDKVYGLLIDKRGMRLHNTYNATFENLNGEGAFLNIFKHTEDTAYASRNTFLRFYKEA